MHTEIYHAGNCRFDSAQTLPVNGDGALDLASLAAFCEDTGKAIAVEHEATWMGCAYDADTEADESACFITEE